MFFLVLCYCHNVDMVFAAYGVFLVEGYDITKLRCVLTEVFVACFE